MENFLNKIFLRSNNLDSLSRDIKDLTLKTPAKKIFEVINSFNTESEIRYVGGCIRKIICKEKIDDIDMATNLEPDLICEALKKANIAYYETGKDHGTITAVLNEFKFEITSLRKDVLTDGRHAKVKFSKDWKEDAARRDFTINSIYSDSEGNLFDPYDGKNDLETGNIKFIGDTDKRIKEDYLRILRYIRFFLEYSKKKHDVETIKKLKINILGISKLSKERLIEELKKLLKLDTLEKISKDKIILDLIIAIFPEFKNIKSFSKLKTHQRDHLKEIDFIFLLSVILIDGSDNVEYFLYKYRLSKKDQIRIKIIDNFFKEKISSSSFSEHNMNKVFHYKGLQSVIDILNYRIIHSKTFDKNLFELKELFKDKKIPKMPISADLLINRYQIEKGKQLGLKLKMIEDEWVKNNFQISDNQVDYIINN